MKHRNRQGELLDLVSQQAEKTSFKSVTECFVNI